MSEIWDEEARQKVVKPAFKKADIDKRKEKVGGLWTLSVFVLPSLVENDLYTETLTEIFVLKI